MLLVHHGGPSQYPAGSTMREYTTTVVRLSNHHLSTPVSVQEDNNGHTGTHGRIPLTAQSMSTTCFVAVWSCHNRTSNSAPNTHCHVPSRQLVTVSVATVRPLRSRTAQNRLSARRLSGRTHIYIDINTQGQRGIYRDGCYMKGCRVSKPYIY